MVEGSFWVLGTYREKCGMKSKILMLRLRAWRNYLCIITEVERMFSLALFKREMKANITLLTIFIYILTMYIVMIVYMFNPESGTGWDDIIKLMPEVIFSRIRH